MDCSPPCSSVHGIFQVRILEWIAISFSRGSAWPWDWTCISCITGRFFTCWAIRKAPLMGLYHPKTSTGPHLRASRPKSLPQPTRACPVFCFHTLCELSKSPSHGLLVHFHYRHAGTFTAFQTRQACFASGPLQLLPEAVFPQRSTGLSVSLHLRSLLKCPLTRHLCHPIQSSMATPSLSSSLPCFILSIWWVTQLFVYLSLPVPLTVMSALW